jgi:hypothetical protein
MMMTIGILVIAGIAGLGYLASRTHRRRSGPTRNEHEGGRL